MWKRCSTNSATLCTRSRREPNMCDFAGAHVPGDFVEAPSQMLQNWVWDKNVLDTFAADYRDPSKKIPAEIIQKMNDARLATAGVIYRRQFAFASLDLALHDQHPEDAPYDCVGMSNPILEKVFLPIDPSTTFVTYFGHLNGYDAGYYGYAWADAIAADMATVFDNAKDKYLDKEAGMRCVTRFTRKAIRATSLSRSRNSSAANNRSTPFLKHIGIKRALAKKKAPVGPIRSLFVRGLVEPFRRLSPNRYRYERALLSVGGALPRLGKRTARTRARTVPPHGRSARSRGARLPCGIRPDLGGDFGRPLKHRRRGLPPPVAHCRRLDVRLRTERRTNSNADQFVILALAISAFAAEDTYRPGSEARPRCHHSRWLAGPYQGAFVGRIRRPCPRLTRRRTVGAIPQQRNA